MGNFQELSVFEQTSFVSNPSFSQIGAERWAVAETAARNIISKLHPTVASHTTRFQVINYLRRLIKNLSGFEVFPYGSVLLKTYLPNGDIDLIVFCDASVEEALANDIVSQLQREDHNNSAEFSVKEIRLLNAENIVVDISFNQVGGLCSLCFLDVVDYIIGNDHLFKQSILVIKAWCYYESRILGANLYKFMDYFSKFDWNNYCITLCGPVRLSSMSESGTGIPESVGGRMLLSEEFYRHCWGSYVKRILTRFSMSQTMKARHQIGNRSSDEVLQEPEEEEGTNFIHDRVSEARRHVGTVDVPSVTYSIAFSEELFNTDSSLASANNASSPESLDSMLDLRGRFETQFNILQYGRCFYLLG
ncbi:hypothetical protein POM88_050356 [Heracleum sosnowskyi]|uniref:Polymerase nucleotidyl transferase domain-containing protein n=1 Tax=Heracleum sosnowskyi TaxID=360622 RepID=A0AAD8GZZ9_9APIA|nr:hypothetical protein POM88_050356 [Heracleum sosnowskyi]